MEIWKEMILEKAGEEEMPFSHPGGVLVLSTKCGINMPFEREC